MGARGAAGAVTQEVVEAHAAVHVAAGDERVRSHHPVLADPTLELVLERLVGK